jgi:sulfur transfer complex TusBCD TusB component (DsrH family)
VTLKALSIVEDCPSIPINPMTSTIPLAPIDVFISYSHKDDGLRTELDVHLSDLKRQGKIVAWHDRKITAGEEWKNVIDEHLESADIILLLISPDFMASDYCYDIELKLALKRHENGEARVIPVILRSADWQDNPLLSRLAALPTDGKAVKRWDNQDDAFIDVVEGIKWAIAQHRFAQMLSDKSFADFYPQGKRIDLNTNEVGNTVELFRASKTVYSNCC